MKFIVDKFLIISSLIFLCCLGYGVILYALPPEIMEKHFVTSVYSSSRYFWGTLSFISPIPLLYWWFFIFLICGIYLGYLRMRKNLGIKKLIQKVLAFILLHFSFFYLSWGFNYFKIPLRDRLDLNHDIAYFEFERELNEITDELCNLRVELNFENKNFTFLEIERELRIRVADVFNELFVFGNNRVRVRVLEPAGCLLVFGTAGIFWPFSGEGYVDSGLDSLVIPFTMAHEFAHGFGWTDEGECNFIALLACRKSDKGLIRYSAELSYWRYLMSNAFRLYPELYKKYLSEISIPIQMDLKSIDYHNNQFPEILPELRDWIYDRYLIFNGVKGGSQSYTGIIKWVINYRKRRI